MTLPRLGSGKLVPAGSDLIVSFITRRTVSRQARTGLVHGGEDAAEEEIRRSRSGG